MRYVIAKNNVSNSEIKARMEYIYDVFHIYTRIDISSSKDVVTLVSIPENAIDLLMIIGHDRTADYYIITNFHKVKENNIVVIACNTLYFLGIKLLKEKNIFLPYNGRLVNFFNGENYGFGFSITDEEIILYRNRKENLEEMLKNTFERRIINGRNNKENRNV